MAKIPFLTPAKPYLKIVETIQQDTLQASVLLQPGPVRLIPATGEINRANSATAPNANVYGILNAKTAGKTSGTLIRRGVLFGYDFTGVNFDAPIYLDDDGDLNTAAGTVSVKIGRVIPMRGVLPGQPNNKALSVEC